MQLYGKMVLKLVEQCKQGNKLIFAHHLPPPPTHLLICDNWGVSLTSTTVSKPML